MSDNEKIGNNGNLTNEDLLKVSAIDIQDALKYTDEHRKRYQELQAKARLERYQKNPGNFIEISELILCVTKNPKSQLGVSVFIHNCRRSELDIAKSELEHQIFKTMMQMDIASEMKREAAKNLIVHPKGGIMGFVRGRK